MPYLAEVVDKDKDYIRYHPGNIIGDWMDYKRKEFADYALLVKAYDQNRVKYNTALALSRQTKSWIDTFDTTPVTSLVPAKPIPP